MNVFLLVGVIIAFAFAGRFLIGSFRHLTPEGRANRLLVFPLGVLAPSAWFTPEGRRVRRQALLGAGVTVLVMMVGARLL
jgi:hypothetical protein